MIHIAEMTTDTNSSSESPTQSPQDQLESINVFDVIMLMVDQMASLAWQKMGLQHDPITGKIQVDLEQARVAIDLTTHLASFIEPKLDSEEDKKRIHNLIRDLRMNYAQRAKS